MKFDGGDGGWRVGVGDGERLAAGGGAAVEDAGASFQNVRAYEGGDELRGFVLDDDLAGAACLSVCDVSCLNAAGGCEEASGKQRDSFLIELLFRNRGAQADCSGGDGLIVNADLVGGGESVFASPALNQP